MEEVYSKFLETYNGMLRSIPNNRVD